MLYNETLSAGFWMRQKLDMREKAIRSGMPLTGTPEACPRDSGHFLSDNELGPQQDGGAKVRLFDQAESTCLGF